MGVVIVSPNTRAPWNTKILSPVTRGLEGWFECDTDIHRLGFNRAPSKPNAKIVGSPVVGSASTRFKGMLNYLNTSIAETDAMTIMVVGKSANEIPAGSPGGGDGNTPMYAGTYTGPAAIISSGTSSGIALHHSANTTLYAIGARDNGSGASTAAQISAPDIANGWGLRALRTSTGEKTRVQNITRGTSAENPSINTRIPTTNHLRIGGGYTGFAGEVDISHIVVFSVRLTDAELDLMAAFMRKRASSIGLSV